MAALDFPLNPVVGDVYTANGNSWKWTGVSWVSYNTLQIEGGGTGQITKSAAFNALSPITATGQLIIGGSGGSSDVLPIGTNGWVLTSDGITAHWAVGGGGGGSMVYPPAGIPLSVGGTSWGTSYTTVGTGTVLALSVSPAFVTPVLGTPASGNLANCTFPVLNQNTTGTASNVTGTIAIANGGTGQTAKAAAFNALAPVTTAGDLILGDSANSSTRLGIGVSSQVLTSNGTTAVWAAIPPVSSIAWGSITGTLSNQTDLATAFVRMGSATLTTGVISESDTLALSALSDTTLRIAPLANGIFYNLLSGGFTNAIKSFPQTDYPLSNISLAADGVYIRFVSYDSTGAVVVTNTDQRMSADNLQIGYIYLKRVTGVTTFMDGAAGPRNVVTRPVMAGNNDYSRTFLNLATDVTISPNTTDTVFNTAGNIYAENANWGNLLPYQKGIPALDPASFVTLNPASAQSTTPPVAGTVVQTTQYWDGSALATIGNNKASVQRWLMGANGAIQLQVGEAEYANLAAAQSAMDIAPFTQLFPGNNLATEIERMAVIKGASNLADTTQAIFKKANGGAGGGSSAGTVTNVSVVAANGFAGTVANPTLTPAITLTTNVSGIAKGNGTAFVAATAETDYVTPTGVGTLSNKTILATKEVKTAMAANAIDLALGNYFSKTLTALTTFTVSNVAVTGTANSFIFDLTDGAAFAITWWAGVKWAGGVAPVLTAAGRDVLGFYTYDAGVTWTGLVLAKDVK